MSETVRDYSGTLQKRGRIDGTMIKGIDKIPEFDVDERRIERKAKQRKREQLPPSPLKTRQVEMFKLSPDMKSFWGAYIDLRGYSGKQLLSACLDARKHRVENIRAIEIVLDDVCIVVDVADLSKRVD